VTTYIAKPSNYARLEFYKEGFQEQFLFVNRFEFTHIIYQTFPISFW